MRRLPVPFLILSAIVMVFSALYLSALIFAGARLAQAVQPPQAIVWQALQCRGWIVCVVRGQTGHRQPELIEKVKSPESCEFHTCQNVPT
jgi:hypothetical protein